MWLVIGASTAACFVLVDADRYDTAGSSDAGHSSEASQYDVAPTGPCPMLAPCRCDLTKPFEPPQPVPNVNEPLKHELSARLTGDFKTMYLHRGDLGGPDHLYVARRARVEDPFGVPELLPQFDGMNIRFAMPSPDDLRLYFSASTPLEDGGLSFSLFQASRQTVEEPFGPREPMPGLGHGAGTIWIDPTETFLTFQVGAELQTRRIHEARRGATGFVDDGPLQVPGHEYVDFAIKSADELTMYFAAPMGANPHDIFVTTRPSTDAPFGESTPIPELDSPGFDWPTWISPDGCTIAIVSSRAGTADIYWARRPE